MIPASSPTTVTEPFRAAAFRAAAFRAAAFRAAAFRALPHGDFVNQPWLDWYGGWAGLKSCTLTLDALGPRLTGTVTSVWAGRKAPYESPEDW